MQLRLLHVLPWCWLLCRSGVVVVFVWWCCCSFVVVVAAVVTAAVFDSVAAVAALYKSVARTEWCVRTCEAESRSVEDDEAVNFYV